MRKNDNEKILEISQYITFEDLGIHYDYSSQNGHRFWKKDVISYNNLISELYKQAEGYKNRISEKKFEEIVLICYFDLLSNPEKECFLKEEIQTTPLTKKHVLLPLYNLHLSKERIIIGEYNLVQFQRIREYLCTIKCDVTEMPEDGMSSDAYFNNIPFVDIIVEARDDEFALKEAKKKQTSFICFLNYCLFSDIKGIDVVSSYSIAGNRDRCYFASSLSLGVLIKTEPVDTSRPDISEYLDLIVQKQTGNNRLIEIIQKNYPESEIEKRIINALNWIGMAIAEKNNAIALTQATFAIECLLQNDASETPITKGIVASISEMIAFLIGTTFNDRTEYEKRFKKIYGLRSKIAHGKSNDISDSQVLDAIDFGKQTIISLLTNPELKTAKTIRTINNYIEKKRYTCIGDN